MRLRALDVERFGALRERSFVLDADAVVVLGPNEAGKSSFHGAVRTVLFGFSPAAARLHPHAVRLGEVDAFDPLQVAATLAFDDGRPDLFVERRLATHPSMRCAPAGEGLGAFARENGVLPGLEGASGSLFDGVYAISADQMADPDGDLDPEIERLLLGEDAAPAFTRLRELAFAIDADRSRLWRRDRRSRRTRAVAIDQRLAELASEARAARRVEAELLALEQEIEERRVRSVDLERDRAERESERDGLRLVERTARVVRESRVDGEVALHAIEGVELVAPGPLLAEIEDAEDALAEPRDRLARPAAPFDEDDERIVARAAEIDALARSETELDHLSRRRDDSLDRAEEAARAALDRRRLAFVDDDVALDERRLADLSSLGETWRQSATGSRSAPLSNGASAFGLAALVGAIGAGAALLAGTAAAGAVSAALAPIVAVAAAKAMDSRAASRPPERLAALATELGIDRALIAEPTGVLRAVEALQRAESLAREADAHDERAMTARGRADEIVESWSALAEELGVVARTDAALPGALRHALASARTRQLEASADRAERGRASREAETARARLEALTARFDEVREALVRAVPGEPSPERAYQRVLDARAAHERSAGALRELRAERAWVSAAGSDGLERALETGEFDGTALREAEARLRDAERAVRNEREETARLEERLARLRPTRPASEVDSEALALRDEREEILARHDRLALLRALLDAGERAHRAAHQPDVLERASAWMDAISGGRYPRLDVPPEGGRLLVHSRETGATVPVGPPLSRGVREQARLCLRLGTLEHLDAEREPLPLVLDEALVHWDSARRAALYRVLARLRGRRQVLMFTCHEALADEAAAAMDGMRVDL
ncbi:MAG: AAA family ATPase [Planctomycetota bacterium]